MVTQILIIMAVVALPVLFHQEWIGLLKGSRQAITPLLNTPTTILWAILIAIFATIISIGITVKTGRLPVSIPVTAVNLGTGLTANLGSQTSVDIIVSANRDQWQSLTDKAFSATVDLNGQGEGTYNTTVNVTAKIKDVTVRSVQPGQLVVTVEPIIKKTVPIVAKFAGTAGNDLVPDVPTLVPDKVEVSGAKSIISTLTEATAEVKLNGETATVIQKVTLQAEDASGSVIAGVTFDPAEVDVSVPLVKAGKLKTLGVRPIITGTPKAGYWIDTIQVTPAAVAVTGSMDALNAATEVTTASFDVSNLSDNAQTQVNLVFPSGLTSADNTSKVTLNISVKPSTTTKTTTPQFVYANLSTALTVTNLSPTGLSALVTGSAAALASVDGQVKVALDLSAYKSAGTYAITITNSMFTLPSGVSLVSFLPSAISVTIENK